MKKPKITADTDNGFRVVDDSGIAVPSRLQVIEYLASREGPAGIDDIAEFFKLNGKETILGLTGRLQRLCARSVLELTPSGKYQLADKDSLVLGKVTGHVDGYGFLLPDQRNGDIYLGKRQMRRVMHGDRVLCRIRKVDHKGRKEGEIVEVLEGQDRKIVGKFEIHGGNGVVIPDDPRFGRTISVPRSATLGAKAGDIVVVTVSGHPVKQEKASGEIAEVIGPEHEPGIKSEIAVRKHELPHIWPHDVTGQIDKLVASFPGPVASQHRTDLSGMPLLTIDGIDARDFDDAVFCEKIQGGWRLVVAIADVSHYVPVNSPLDLEAYQRGTSVYFPDRVIPMLPEQLSNDICSLNPEQDRDCMVCDMRFDATGSVVKYEFYQGVMRSQARLTYEIVEQIVIHRDSSQRTAWGAVTGHLDSLYDLSRRLRECREGNGSIDFNFPEPYIEFDAQKRISNISARERTGAHRLIEECMLVANVCAAKFLQENLGDKAIYRNHEGPDQDGLAKVREFLSGLGLSLGGQQKPSAIDYRNLLVEIEDRPEILSVVQTVLLRSLSQAVYSPEQLGHFALAFPVYTHFTSPIRRYSDLVVHRLIKSLIGLNRYGQPGRTMRLPKRLASNVRLQSAGLMTPPMMSSAG